MKNRQIIVEGITIQIEQIHQQDYISLTDIARKFNERPSNLINNWLKNNSTFLFLVAWERAKNPDFNYLHMQAIKDRILENSYTLSPTKWIEETNAIGMTSTRGRYANTFAHKDIALNFCYWLSPEFQVFMLIKFQELLEREFQRKSLKWHISKITDNVEEIRNLLDTIPGQEPERNRIAQTADEEE